MDPRSPRRLTDAGNGPQSIDIMTKLAMSFAG